MSEKESGFILTERKEKKPEFAVLTFESGKEVYRENPDKMNRRRGHAFKGVIPEGATIQVRVNFSRPGDFLPCGVLKICDIPNRETKVLNIGLDDDWEIKSPVKTEEGFEIRSWVLLTDILLETDKGGYEKLKDLALNNRQLFLSQEFQKKPLKLQKGLKEEKKQRNFLVNSP